MKATKILRKVNANVILKPTSDTLAYEIKKYK